VGAFSCRKVAPLTHQLTLTLSPSVATHHQQLHPTDMPYSRSDPELPSVCNPAERSYVQRDRAPPEDMFIGEPWYRQFIQATLTLRDATQHMQALPPSQPCASSAHRLSALPFLDTT